MDNSTMTYSYDAGKMNAYDYMNSMNKSRNMYGNYGNNMYPMYGSSNMNKGMYNNNNMYGSSGMYNNNMTGMSGYDDMYKSNPSMYNMGNTTDMYNMGRPMNTSSGMNNMYGSSGMNKTNMSGMDMYENNGMTNMYGSSGMDSKDMYGSSNMNNMYGSSGMNNMHGSSGMNNMYGSSGMNNMYGSSGMDMTNMNMNDMNAMTKENPSPYSVSADNKGETSIAGIVNVKYEIKDGVFHVSVNIADLIEVGSFTLDTEHPMINFTQGNSFYGYSLTFGIDYDKKEFYFSGYVKIPFVSPFETGRFVIYSW